MKKPRPFNARGAFEALGATLPQFDLSSESSLDGGDAAETLERPPVRVRRAPSRPFMRTAPILEPYPELEVEVEVDSELEIEPQDILMEAYAEPPQSARPERERWEQTRAAPLPRPNHSYLDDASWSPAPVSVVTAISVPPPRYETVSPMATIASTSGPSPTRNEWLGFALAAVGVALVTGVVVGVALMPSARTAVLERLRGSPVAETQQPKPVLAAAAAQVPRAPAAKAAIPSAIVEALPSPRIEPNKTVLMFHKGRGRRVFVDGQVVSGAPDPIKVTCGKHKVQVGAKGRSRVVNLPCGSELPLD